MNVNMVGPGAKTNEHRNCLWNDYADGKVVAMRSIPPFLSKAVKLKKYVCVYMCPFVCLFVNYFSVFRVFYEYYIPRS